MSGSVKLSLSSNSSPSERDPWRSISDLAGSALVFAVWVLLWVWLAAGVVAPLSSAKDQVARASAVGSADRI
jgi:hypothetical protein